MTPSGLPLLDHIESAKRRDAALQRVAENAVEWMPLALLELEQLARNSTGWANLDRGFTGEFIRQALTPRIGHPHHNNAFGALIRTAITRKIIVPTGEYRAMQAVNSHSRKTPVYRFAVLGSSGQLQPCCACRIGVGRRITKF